MFSLTKNVWKIYKPFHKAIFVILLFIGTTNILGLFWPLIYGKLINAVIAKTPLSGIIVILATAFGIMISQNIVSRIQASYQLSHFDYDAPRYTSNLTFRKLFSLSIGQHHNEHSGLTQSVVSDGQNAVQNILNTWMFSIVPIMVQIPLAVIALTLLSWRVGLIVCAGLIVNFFLIIFVNKWFIPLVRQERAMSQQISKKRSEAMRNAVLVLTSGESESLSKKLDNETIEKDKFSKSFWTRFMFMAQIVRPSIINLTTIIAIMEVTILVGHGMLRAGDVVTVMLWTNMTLSSFGTLSRMQREILLSAERARKYFTLLDIETDVKEPTTPIIKENFEGAIEFENVSFKYHGRRIIGEDDENKKITDAKRFALQNVNFSIKSGEHIAFVGHSGAGKSTAITLLIRGSDPTSGTIRIDGIDLNKLHLDNFRKHLGTVEQHIILFDDTIRNNICFGLGERVLSDKDLEEIGRVSRIDEFFADLPDGWDTLIGENGIKLSGGQRQRVGIARALAKNPAILIFDEATSSLDAKNEALIKEAIRDASRGRTSITIAHRLSTIKDADRIFVFEKGGIVGIGTHEELMSTCNTYKELVSHQTVLL